MIMASGERKGEGERGEREAGSGGLAGLVLGLLRARGRERSGPARVAVAPFPFFLTESFSLFLFSVFKSENKNIAKLFIKIGKILFRELNTYRIIWHWSCHQNKIKLIENMARVTLHPLFHYLNK